MHGWNKDGSPWELWGTLDLEKKFGKNIHSWIPKLWMWWLLLDFSLLELGMEGVIMDEVTDFMSFLKSNEGQPLAPDVRLKISTLNVIWGVLSSGNRVKHDDAKFVGIFNRQKEYENYFSWSILRNLDKSVK